MARAAIERLAQLAPDAVCRTPGMGDTVFEEGSNPEPNFDLAYIGHVERAAQEPKRIRDVSVFVQVQSGHEDSFVVTRQMRFGRPGKGVTSVITSLANPGDIALPLLRRFRNSETGL